MHITIEDINDNPPFFAKSAYYFPVAENAPISASIGIISALDKDGESSLEPIATFVVLRLFKDISFISRHHQLRVRLHLSRRKTSSRHTEHFLIVNQIGLKYETYIF